MGQRRSSSSQARVEAENIGGIQETAVAFSPGVTILEGRNATNRTSFLRAVMAALGSDTVVMKGDADEAEVTLTVGDETYTREASRRGGDVVTDGDPYLDEPLLADLFAFLLESNDARRAVAASDDLRDLIMRPVDTAAIRADIDRLVEERDALEEELTEIDEAKRRLPGLEEQRTQLRAEIEEKKAELADTEAELESADADVEETREEKAELEDKLAELRDKRASLDDVRYDLETERETLEALKRERSDLEAELADLPETPTAELEEIESEVGRLRERKHSLESEVSELQSVIGFNEEMLEDAGSGAFQGQLDETDDVTDRLLPDDDVVCWTCGSEVETDQIESTVGQLRELSQTKIGEVNDLDDRIADLTDEKTALQQSERERDRIESRLSEIETELAEADDRIDRLTDDREDLHEEIEAIEAEVEDLESEDYSAVLDLHKEANRLEYELGKLETDLERVEDRIEDVEDRIEEREVIEAQVAEIKAEIEDCRTKIDRIEADAVEEFNDHMDALLETLGYANLERIWIERVEREVREGRRTVEKTVFELHVVRTSESGTAYEDTVAHLSESEREVTGLVFALAGYLAHEVYEDLPFMLLDSLEAIDSERIATLVEYLSEYTEFLLVALLPEDASALDESYERITDI